MTTDREQLRELYLDDLRRLVEYHGSLKPRARRVNMVWAKIPSLTTNLININDYENVWVWSDTHFNHKNIIKYCKRPFSNKEEMNHVLIENYNDVVGYNDLVIWVGDVAFANDTTTNELLDQMNGDRILIVGNHDIDRKGRLKKLYFNETHLIYTIDDPICPLIFTHYTMENTPYPWINIHGHVHNSSYFMENSLQHINVSVEVLDYKPINLATLWNQARTRLESMDNCSKTNTII